MEKRIILRYPEGVVMFETDNTNLAQCFINWIIKHKHYTDYNENTNTFTFPHMNYVSACNVKWTKLCNNLITF